MPREQSERQHKYENAAHNGTITIKFQIGKYWKSKSIKLGIVFLFLLINVATNELQAHDVLLTNNQ